MSIEPVDAEERDADQEEAEGREGADGDEVAEGDADEPRRAQDDEELPDGEEEGDAPRGLPCPGAPSTAERIAHELTHYPYRKWCEHCVRGRAVGPNAKKVPAAGRETSVPRAHMDYAYLQEEVVEIEDEFKTETTATMSLTILVMIETLCESVWVYTVNAKGVLSDAWLPGKIATDLATVGVANTRIVFKTYTEPAIVELRRAVGESRGGTPTGHGDSRVGDSNSNARIERTIREVKGLIRTLRSDLKEKLGADVPLDSAIVPWMVRHAGYVLTRCRVHPCRRTGLHRIKGQRSHRPMIPFGGAVLFKRPKTRQNIGDFEDRCEKGRWV